MSINLAAQEAAQRTAARRRREEERQRKKRKNEEVDRRRSVTLSPSSPSSLQLSLPTAALTPVAGSSSAVAATPGAMQSFLKLFSSGERGGASSGASSAGAASQQSALSQQDALVASAGLAAIGVSRADSESVARLRSLNPFTEAQVRRRALVCPPACAASRGFFSASARVITLAESKERQRGGEETGGREEKEL